MQRALHRIAAVQRGAFYASTPAYRAVLELHGFGDLQPALVRQGNWSDMGALVPDELFVAAAARG